MTAVPALKLPGGRRYVSALVTLGLFIALFGTGSVRYENFGSGQVFLDLLIDNAFLLVAAVGATFVILTGGIDLSVGAMAALSTVVSATLVQKQGWPALVVIPLVLAGGALAGYVMGSVIHHFEIQPFIVTLAGMFLARGLCYSISVDSISITDPFLTDMAQTRIPLAGDLFVSPSVVIALVVLGVAFYVLHYTRTGRTIYAVGGSEQSALLMGLPTARVKITAYAISGFCSALAGVLLSFYMLSGYALHAVGMELDAIAAVVIGGTLLTGGSGYVLGTLLGVLVLGVIQTIISFQGTLSSWWTKIVIGLLLFVFILLQKVIAPRHKT